MTLTIREDENKKAIEKSVSVSSLLSEVRVKDRLERKAFEALERRLEPQVRMCKVCKGDGMSNRGDTCAMCQGSGAVVEDADMRAIELVLAPKFPKTSLSVTADLDGMTTESLLDLIDGIGK